MEVPVIEIEKLTVNLGGEPVLSGVSLTVYKGDFVVLVGPNGAGKTTLIRAILGFLPRAQGSIRLFGREIEQFTERYRLGYVPQKTYYERTFPISVSEVVSLGLVAKTGILRRAGRNQAERVEEALRLVGMANFRDRRVGELSGGQQQRVFVARAIVGDPDALILDEPTGGTDVSFQERFFELLRELNAEKGLSVIISTHQADMKPPPNAKVALLNKRLIHYCGWDEFKHRAAECMAMAGLRS